MSKETFEWLNTQVLVGFTAERGNAWHYRQDKQGDEPNHYNGAIPLNDVLRRLFHWHVLESDIIIRTKDDEGNVTEFVDPERKALVRSDDPSTVFSIFKNGYTVHQYRKWLIDTVSLLIDDSDLAIGTAGLLNRGAKAFVTVELPETVKTPMGFDIRPHLLACTSHDGTLATTFQLVSTVVVCDNTLAGALGENTPHHKIRHSKHSVGKLQTVREALHIVHEYTDELTAELERLATQHVTDNEFQRIVERLVPATQDIDLKPRVKSRTENKRDLLRHLYTNDPMVAPWKGTALGAFQAWSTYQHHHAGSDKTRVSRNMLAGLTGKVEAHDQFALTTIKEVVGV